MGDCLIYTNVAGRLNYTVGGEVILDDNKPVGNALRHLFLHSQLAGFHFFNSILGRKGGNQLNGLQKNMAIMMKAGGSMNAALSELNAAGLASAASTAERELDKIVKGWENTCT